MKKLITLFITLFIASFLSGCASVQTKASPELGKAVYGAKKIGFAGLSGAAELYNSNSKVPAVDIDGPEELDQSSMKKYMEERGIDTMVLITTTAEEDTRVNKRELGIRIGTTALKLVLAAFGGTSAVNNTNNNMTFDRVVTVTTTITIYGADGSIQSRNQVSQDYVNQVVPQNATVEAVKMLLSGQERG